MSILRNKYEIIDETKTEGYTIPAMVKKNEEGVPFKKAVLLSTLLHPGSVGFTWGLIFILGLFGIKFTLFNPPPLEQKKDIEFVLVDKPAPPKNPETKNRAVTDSRTGGIRDKKKPVVLPTGRTQSPSKPSTAASSLNKMIKQQQKEIRQEISQQKEAPKKVVEPPKNPIEAPAPQTRPSPRPMAQRPTAAPSSRPVSAPKTVAPRPTTPFSVPVPSAAPKGNYLATGPISGTNSAKSTANSGGSYAGSGAGARRAPTPSLSTYQGTGAGKSATAGSGGSRSGGGYVGNPGGGGGRPGIDALKEPDFGPYMRDLQRRIKFNWNPPKGNESKRVVLLFKIAKNGQLISCRVHKSSGLPAADQAALNAVKLTAPFRPLPAEYKGTSIDIQFTFDYNVFGASKY